jgi:ribosomal protein L37E
MREADKTKESEPEYTYRCETCGVECRYDNEGNCCHSCGRGWMRRVRKY